MKRDLDDKSVTVGSDNVFADIGITDPELAMKKSDLAGMIRDNIRERGWTLTKAAKIMGIDQSKLSAIVRGRVGDYTLDRLIQLVMNLGQSVYVDVVGPNVERRVTRDRSGMMTVRYTAKGTSKIKWQSDERTKGRQGKITGRKERRWSGLNQLSRHASRQRKHDENRKRGWRNE